MCFDLVVLVLSREHCNCFVHKHSVCIFTLISAEPWCWLIEPPGFYRTQFKNHCHRLYLALKKKCLLLFRIFFCGHAYLTDLIGHILSTSEPKRKKSRWLNELANSRKMNREEKKDKTVYFQSTNQESMIRPFCKRFLLVSLEKAYICLITCYSNLEIASLKRTDHNNLTL